MAQPADRRRPQLPRSRRAARGRLHLRGHRSRRARSRPDARWPTARTDRKRACHRPTSLGALVAGADPRRRARHPPAAGHADASEAGDPARRPAVHPLHDRLARPPRRRRRRPGLRLPARSAPRDARRRDRRRATAALRRGARAARHGRRDQVRRGPARGPLLRPQRRQPHRPRPDRADGPARRAAAPGRRSASTRSTTSPGSGWSAAPRTARSSSSSRSPIPPRSTPTRSPPACTCSRRRSSTSSRRTRTSRSSARSGRGWSATGSTRSASRATGWTSARPTRYLDACWDILGRKVETEPGRSVDGDGRFVSDGRRRSPTTPRSAEHGLRRRRRRRSRPDATIGPRAVHRRRSERRRGGDGSRLRASSRPAGSAPAPR